MANSHRYAMLISSLPYHGPLFGARQTPLSRIQLDQRLRLLDEPDQTCLAQVMALLDWSRLEPDLDDTGFLARARAALGDIADPFARDLLVWRLELRTLVAALRRRHRGQPAPADDVWGLARQKRQIQHNWSEPAFRLQGAHPWLPEAARLVERGDAPALERLLLGVTWAHLERISDGHHFDFPAVIIYVMRWDLIARWTSYDATHALQCFDEMTARALDQSPAGHRLA